MRGLSECVARLWCPRAGCLLRPGSNPEGESVQGVV